MAIARGEIVDNDQAGIYHCISRCVRRAWLCGKDPYTGQDFSHRKGWIEQRLKHLANNFAVDVCSYSIMTNHIHVILHNRPDKAQSLSDREVASRWLSIYSGRYIQDSIEAQDDTKVDMLVSDNKRIAKLRKRLSNISWFMKTLNENIARKANLEDNCKGKFWESRFKCTRLLDSSAVLACMAYVDLNPVRAGLATLPENSDYTSVKLRSTGRNARLIMQKHSQRHNSTISAKAHCDSWLASVFRTEKSKPGEELVPATVDQYLQLLDWTGRQLREDKPGVIPAHIRPIMQRLEINMDNWLETADGFGKRFGRMAGKVEQIKEAAQKAGRRFFKGVREARNAFFQPSTST